MQTVAQILQAKGGSVWTIGPDATVFDALSVMADKGVGAIVVTDDDGLCGILSERDYARKVILFDRSSHETTVSEIMTSKVLVVAPDASIDECMALMTDKRVRHLPVMDGEELVGIITDTDFVAVAINLLEQLEETEPVATDDVTEDDIA